MHRLSLLAPLLSLALLCLTAFANGPVSELRFQEGWIALFDGESLYGWQATTSANWRCEAGCIVVDDGRPGFLQTTSQFGDFELRLDFQSEANTNSGVFVRSAEAPQDPVRDCYEINIAPDSHPYPTGSIVARCKRSCGVSLANTWQQMQMRAVGNEITVLVDGQETCHYTDREPPSRGCIGLQYNDGAVRFRRVELRPLGLTSLVPPVAEVSAEQPARSADLATQWKDHPDMKGEFTLTAAGELKVVGGPGQLESRDEYADFILQLQCRTNAPGLNSGIFFRCIPGDRMMGYESQIHNGYDDDRQRPADYGTGGIFRRSWARRIVARDEEWFTKTIVAVGRHFAVWVNGYQVTDWTDDRSLHENPRRGCRLKPGTIMIQAHDPKTDLRFRGIRVAEQHPQAKSRPSGS